MKIAIQFGAGNIGRGLMGQLFFESGYQIIFIDTNKNLISLLNERGSYTLKLLDAYKKKAFYLDIDRFTAYHIYEDSEKIVDLIASSSIMSTAVGVGNLENIAETIATGLKKRMEKNSQPLNIYLCENLYEAPKILKDNVEKFLNKKEKEWIHSNIGFVGMSVARMVPSSDIKSGEEDPLLVVADSYHKLPFDKKAVKGEMPDVEGMIPVENFKAEVERKLYTHNLGHAACAYLGYLKGYTYIHETFNDSYITSIFENALNETSTALIKTYPNDFTPEDQNWVLKDVKIRFSNPLLKDQVCRVARDPIRKLGPTDRLIGSAKLCLSQGIFPSNIAIICGAALNYDYKEDQKAMELQKLIKTYGIPHVLRKICNIDPESEFGKAIEESYRSTRKLKL